jgi:Inovirus Coat protein B
MKLFKQAMKYGSVAMALAAASTASHAVVDVSGVVTEIQGTIAPIGLIGAAVLIVCVTIAAYKWIRRAM